MTESRFKLHYEGSLFWLIFWLIFFFPVAFVLLLTASSFDIGDKTYILHYNGSRGWLAFWVIVFFPVAFLLLFLKGYSVKTVERSVAPESGCGCSKEGGCCKKEG